jgi:sialate O-acetylesterase
MRTRPNILYNAMMHPLIPFACRGVVWYQGEANTRSVEAMQQYSESLQTWLKYLRKSWGKEDFHLMPVMLPGFGRVLNGGTSKDQDHPGAHTWAVFRQSQLNLHKMPGTGVANTIDLGDPKNIHPKDKLPIGHRLTQLALKMVHKKDVVPQGPMLKEIKIEKSSVTVHFLYSGAIKTIDGKAPTGFWLAGKDKEWFKADAEISGETVVLTAKGVAAPVAVRYAYAAMPKVNLVNGADLPAVPFRTDSWGP